MKNCVKKLKNIKKINLKKKLTLLSSSKLHNITISFTFLVNTSFQNLNKVEFMGPWVAMKYF
jgi:hypothetical protein